MVGVRSRRPIGIEQSIQASIEIPDLQISYFPGDVVHGIVKKVNITNLTENVGVLVRLVVRIETQVGVDSRSSDGKTTTWHYTGERQLIDLRQQVYNGLAQPGINTWPFSITIPQQTPAQSFNGLSSLPEPLPPTFYRHRENMSFGHREYIYVETFLEANVYHASGPCATAKFPLNVQAGSTAQPITDTVPQVLSFNQTVKTLHLDPQYAGKDLSFRQHMQTIFQRSTLPKYSFDLLVEYPTVIQLEHPEALSFKIRTKPIQDPNQTSDFLTKSPPVVTLVSARISLQSATHVDDMEGRVRELKQRQEGRWQDNYLVDWSSSEAARKKRGSAAAAASLLVVPDETQQPGASFDLGAALGLRISAHGVSLRGDGRFARPLCASFATRHVTHAHRLWWRLVVAVAGRTRRVTVTTPAVLLLGPSRRDEDARRAALPPPEVARSHHEWAAGAADLPFLAARVLLPEPVPAPVPVPVSELAPPVYVGVEKGDPGRSGDVPSQKA